MKVIVTSIGRRVQLIEHLKKTFTVVGVDASDNNAARFFVDEFYKIPRCNQEGYIQALLDIAKKCEADLLIPLYEPEFLLLCEHRHEFELAGTRVLLSDREVIDICNDKTRTQNFFEREEIKAPKLTEHAPAVVKPVCGMGSQGIFVVNTEEELAAAKVLSDKYIVQERIEGVEYTIDVLCDFTGHPVSIVPRVRQEVRSGEVSKSVTEHQERIIEDTRHLIKRLNSYGTVIGPVTVQCFLTKDQESVFIEINPRFGGGVPLTMEAGVDYGKCLEAFLQGREPEEKYVEFSDISMMRYDRAVYLPVESER